MRAASPETLHHCGVGLRKSGAEDLFTARARQRALEITNPRSIGHRPGVLPIYAKMQVRLFGKECVRFGLMRGCRCVVGHIIFADDEPPHPEALSGEPIQLHFMLVALILRAVDAHWSLRHAELPHIPTAWDRR